MKANKHSSDIVLYKAVIWKFLLSFFTYQLGGRRQRIREEE